MLRSGGRVSKGETAGSLWSPWKYRPDDGRQHRSRWRSMTDKTLAARPARSRHGPYTCSPGAARGKLLIIKLGPGGAVTKPCAVANFAMDLRPRIGRFRPRISETQHPSRVTRRMPVEECNAHERPRDDMDDEDDSSRLILWNTKAFWVLCAALRSIN